MRSARAPAGATPLFAPEDKIAIANSLYTDHYLFGDIEPGRRSTGSMLSVAFWGREDGSSRRAGLQGLVRPASEPVVFKSAQTIKCDVARSAFAATGKSIVWAVADTGIDGDHPHFKTHDTLELENGLKHRDFSTFTPPTNRRATPRLSTRTGMEPMSPASSPARRVPTAQRARSRFEQDVQTSDSFDDVGKSYADHDDPILGLRPNARS